MLDKVHDDTRRYMPFRLTPLCVAPFSGLECPRSSTVHLKCSLQVFLTISGGSISFSQLDYKLSEDMKEVLSLIWVPHRAKSAGHASYIPLIPKREHWIK